MTAALQWSDVRASIGGREILSGVSFSVPWGSVTGFVGVNGAGKTTSIRALLGLEPHAGSTVVDGTPYVALHNPLRTVGCCPDSLGAVPSHTGARHLRALAARAGLGLPAVRRALRDVGLDRVNVPIRAYSLGMRRRLAIAGALVAEPRILVLDEPFDGLDPEGRRWLSGRLAAHAAGGGSVLLSAHALDEIEDLIERIVCLHRGSVLFEGSTEAFLSAHAAEVVGVRADQPEVLTEALRKRGGVVHARRNDGLAVRHLRAEQIARIARDSNVLITELTPRRLSLSAAFAAAVEGAR